jgi:MacB-like periplasmic core domain
VLARFRSVLAALLGRHRFENGMAEELRFHLEQEAERLVRQGVPPDEAARRARLAFGSVDNVKDDCREARGLRLLDDLTRNVRWAFHLWRRSPGFTVSALATIGLCLGANLAIFAVVDSILLRPLPFPDAGRLVRVFNTYPKAGVLDDGASVTNYYERRGRIAALPSLAIYRAGTAIVGDTGATEREDIMRVSPGFFATLGVGPVMGDVFTDAEMTPGADDVAIVSDEFWRQRLDADPGAIGRRVRVNGALRSRGWHRARPWPTPRRSSPRRTTRWPAVIQGRRSLPPPGSTRSSCRCTPTTSPPSGPRWYCCSELAVRQALGASRRHVVRAVLVETVALTLAGSTASSATPWPSGGVKSRFAWRLELRRARFLSTAWRLVAVGTALGLAGAWLAGRLMQAVLFKVSALDARVLAATAAVTSATAVVACLVPSARAARVPPTEALTDQ